MLSFLLINRLKYLNLEHNEISSIPHLRLLGARVRQEESSKQENQASSGDNSSSNVNGIESEVNGILINKKQGEAGEETRNEEFILDEVDEILDQKLAGDEETSAVKDEAHEKLQSSALLEDHSLLGNDIIFIVDFEFVQSTIKQINAQMKYC